MFSSATCDDDNKGEKSPENLDIEPCLVMPILPYLTTIQSRPSSSFEEILTNIFNEHLDDILTSVDMNFDEPGNPEMLVNYDEELVQQIIKAAVRQNIYSRLAP